MVYFKLPQLAGGITFIGVPIGLPGREGEAFSRNWGNILTPLKVLGYKKTLLDIAFGTMSFTQ